MPSLPEAIGTFRRWGTAGCRFKLDSPQQLFGYAPLPNAAHQKNSYPNLRFIQLPGPLPAYLTAKPQRSNSCKLTLLATHRAPAQILSFDAPILRHGTSQGPTKLPPIWTQKPRNKPNELGKCDEDYLWVMVKTPSQLEGGSSNIYSWHRCQYAREGPSPGHLSRIL